MCSAQSLLTELSHLQDSAPQKYSYNASGLQNTRTPFSEVDEAADSCSPLRQDQTLCSSQQPLVASAAPVEHKAPISASPASMFLSFFSSPPPSTPKPDDEGQVVSGYTLGPIIGYGATSIIRRAYSSSGGVVAIKIIRRADLVKSGNAPQARLRLQHEASVWSSLSHEHILPLFSAVHTPYADCFITLLCPAGSLFDILKRDGNPALPQDDAGMMFRQVVRGLRYLHEVARLVHRDLKLENVLVDEMGVCRIGDFGMSRRIGVEEEDEEELYDAETPPLEGLSQVHRAASLSVVSKKAQKSAPSLATSLHRNNTTRHRNSTSSAKPVHSFQPGSVPYAAPELLLPQTSDALRPHPGQDIWALGVMLYALLTGRLPFRDSFEPRLQMKILNGAYDVPEGIGRGAERLLQGCLERNVMSRWTIAMVDEVAWGVGWGSEGDLATPAEEDDEFDFPIPIPQPVSRSRSRAPDLTSPSESTWQMEEPLSRGAAEAANRRSSSRVKRSISRAPLYDSRSPSKTRSRRSRAPSPTSSILTSPIDLVDGHIFSLSAMSSFERGRRPGRTTYHSTSRSPSASVAPTTPLDGSHPFSNIPSTREHSEELSHDPIRGRQSLRSFGGHDEFLDGDGTRLPEADRSHHPLPSWNTPSWKERLELQRSAPAGGILVRATSGSSAMEDSVC